MPTQLLRMLEDPGPTDRDALARARRRAARRRPGGPGPARAGRRGRRAHRGDLRHGRDLRAAASTTASRSTASRSPSATDGRVRLGGPTLFAGYEGEPGADRRGPRRRLVPHRRRRHVRRGRPAAAARPPRRHGRLRRGERARRRGRRAAARAPRGPGRRGGRARRPEWGRAGRRGRRRARSRSTRPATGSATRIRGPGRRARSSPSTRCRCWPTARPTGSPCAASHGAEPERAGERPVSADARLRSVPMRTRFRGITVREGLLLRGPAGWGEFSPFLEYDARGGRTLAARRRGGRERATGRRRCATGCRSTSPCPPSAPSRPHALVLAGGLPHGEGQGRRARADASPTTRPGSRRCATRSGPAGAVRVDANGGWDVDEAVHAIAVLDRAAGGLEYVEQPCADVEELAACRRRSTCRSPPTSRSVAPRTPTGCATSRPPTSPCSRCSRWAACGPACASPRTSDCPSWSPRPWRPRSASPPASRSPRRCPTLPYACGLATVQLLDRRRRRRPAAARRRGPARGAARGRRGRAGPPRGRRPSGCGTGAAASPSVGASGPGRID